MRCAKRPRQTEQVDRGCFVALVSRPLGAGGWRELGAFFVGDGLDAQKGWDEADAAGRGSAL